MPITHIQGASNSSGSSGTATIAASFGVPVAAGDAVIVVFGYGGPSDLSAAPVITDDQSNSYSYLERAFQSGQYGLGVAYKLNITNGPSTITVTFPESHAFPSIIIDEYAGVKSLDTHVIAAGNTGAGGPNDVSSGSILTAGADLVHGYGWVNSGAVSSGSAFTATEEGGSFSNVLAEYLLQDLAGSVAATFTGDAGQNYVAGLVALSPVPALNIVIDAGLPAEASVAAISDGAAPMEALTSFLPAPLWIEWTASLLGSPVNRDSLVPIELLATVRQAGDATLSIEAIARAVREAFLMVENLSEGLVTAAVDSPSQLEVIMPVRTDVGLPSAWAISASFWADTPLLFEIAGEKPLPASAIPQVSGRRRRLFRV
jgi:hypothetical protein